MPAGASRSEYHARLALEFRRCLDAPRAAPGDPWTPHLAALADARSAPRAVRAALAGLDDAYDLGDARAQAATARHATRCVAALAAAGEDGDDGDLLAAFLQHLLLLVSYRRRDAETFLTLMGREERGRFRAALRAAFAPLRRGARGPADTMAQLAALQVSERERLAARLCDRVDVVDGIPLAQSDAAADGAASARSANVAQRF